MLKYISYVLALTVMCVACDDEDFTGDSTLTASSPTITVSGAGSITVDEGDKIRIDVTISEAQIVDIPVYVTVTGGDASSGDDFTIDNTNSRALIAAGRTSAEIVISVTADGVAESDETFTIQIGDERTTSASMTSTTATVTIMDVTEVVAPSPTLALGLDWDLDVSAAVGGEAQDPRDIADIRFMLKNSTDTIYVADGSGFESFSIANNMIIAGGDTTIVADGSYELAADFYDVVELDLLGDALGGVNVDLHMTYDQAGVQSGAWDYEAGLHTAFEACQGITLATIVVAGDDFTLTSVGERTYDISDFIGSYAVTWIWGGGNQIPYTTTFSMVDDNTIQNDAFFAVFFGSEMQVEYDIDPETYGITIPAQIINVDLEPDGVIDTVEIAGSGGLIDVCTGDFQIQWIMDQLTTETYGRDNALKRDIRVPLADWLGADNDLTVYTKQ